MQWKDEFYERLREEFATIKERSKGKYSLRAYAHKLKVPPSTLSQMMTGKQKWTLTPKRASEIVQRMGLPASQKSRLLTLMGVPPKVKYREIPKEELNVFSSPVHFAVMYAFALPERFHDVKSIAARFGLSISETEKIIGSLIEKTMLTKENGNVKVNSEFWMAGDGPSDETIRNFHRSGLQLAGKALDNLPTEERHFSSFTFAGNKGQLKLLTEEIRIFHERMRNLLNKEEGNDEVFNISLGIFPLRDIKEMSKK